MAWLWTVAVQYVGALEDVPSQRRSPVTHKIKLFLRFSVFLTGLHGPPYETLSTQLRELFAKEFRKTSTDSEHASRVAGA